MNKTKQSGFLSQLKGKELGLIPVLLGLVIIWIIFQVINQNFLSGRNLSNLIIQMVEIGLLGIGETFILLLGEIDLSIASVSGVSAAVLVLLSNGGVSAWLAIVIAIALGALIGAFQGVWVTYIGVPAFIVTLAGSFAYQGVLLMMLGNTGTVPITSQAILNITSTYLPQSVGWVILVIVAVLYFLLSWNHQKKRQQADLSTSFAGLYAKTALLVVVSVIVFIVLNSYNGVPIAGLILLIFIVVFSFITTSTPYGRHIFALGGNAEASRRSGIKIRGIRLSVFILSGAFGALGGIIGASFLGSASPASGGGNLQMDAIAVAVIGGTSLFGGRGSVWNALVGALVIGSVENGMDLLSAPSSVKYIVEGAILLLAVTIDTVTRRRRQRSGK
ncbi:ABC transporter permease [Pullulanibacillus sp. KACC 23026]|uniref:sugar ABC transporter permease n=1 Tax=Pullulanibacillus sp. KACC 23026 TaxID=3028315 RepID=UPI0023AFD19A|nr:ABC transporter permease [Pullulanibacillus sp. KACC 23026]WEG14755.1 ABC transporter permease [Pullulanibacillus sp. KACC 23026]